MPAPVVHKILAPVEFTENGAVDMRYAVSLAAQLGAELVLLAVIDTPATVSMIGYHKSEAMRRRDSGVGAAAAATADVETVERDGTLHGVVGSLVRRILQGIVDDASASGVDARGRVVVSEDVEENILKEALVQKVDLIVLRSHGRSGFLKALLGSTATEILSAAPCPVLVARA